MQATLAAPFGTVLVTVDDEAHVAAVDLSPASEPEYLPAGFPAGIAEAFGAYLAGEAHRPSVPVGDVDATTFQREVYETLASIEPGDPVTYGELARRIGKPGAARAVGQALRANPLPLVWPCHRVVAKDGLGGFGGAHACDDETGKLAIKRWLLEHERNLRRASFP